MSKVITFSLTFPTYHPKAGKPTYFVKSILRQQNKMLNKDYFYLLLKLNIKRLQDGKLTEVDIANFYNELLREDEPFYDKMHTIRSGHRRKVGDKFSPRVWSGKPYCSPKITIAQDMEIKKVWDFEIKDRIMYVDKMPLTIVEYRELIAMNDGLTYQDFKDWFKYPKPFSGQIICWDESINY